MDYSLSILALVVIVVVNSLNPYSNGLLSENYEVSGNIKDGQSLNPYSNGLLSELKDNEEEFTKEGLNPYSNGLLSETLTESMLRFSSFNHPTEILTISQRVSPIRMIFSQMYVIKCFIPNKKRIIFS